MGKNPDLSGVVEEQVEALCSEGCSKRDIAKRLAVS
jgi:transposase